MVGPRTFGGALALVAACRGAGPPRARCKELALAGAAQAVATCREAYRASRAAADGAMLAFALAGESPPDVAALTAIAREIGDRPAGADAWHQLGEALRVSHPDADLAIAAFVRALAHRAPTDVRGRARDEASLAERFLDRGHYQIAAEHLAAAYRGAEALGEAGFRAHVLTTMIGFYFLLGDERSARATVEQARAVIAPESPYYGILRSDEAQVELAEEHFAVAAALCREVIAIADRQGYGSLAHGARLDLASAQLALGDVAGAEATLATDPVTAQADAAWRASHAHAAAQLALARADFGRADALAGDALAEAPDTWRWLLATDRARAALGRGDLAAAEAHASAAIAGLEARRDAVEIDDLRAPVLAARRGPYEVVFRVAVARGEPVAAFAALQATTARGFLDVLAARAAGPADRAVQAAARRHANLRGVARALRASPPARPDTGAALVHQLAGLHVLSYYVTDDDVWLVALGDGAVTVHALPVGRRALAEAIAGWLGALGDRDRARALGDAVFPPAVRPPDGARIYVATDGPLAEAPLAALVIGDRRLIERYDLAEIPSAAVLAALVARPAATGPAVVLGDPGGDLPGARAEATRVGAALGVAPAIGAAATRDALVGGRAARVLHVAAHAALGPLEPALVLADGPLTAGQILDEQIGPDTAVLASCASASGAGADGWGALASSLLAAGTGTVIASRWSIDDAVARDDIAALYRAGIDDPIHATAEVQRAAIAAGRPVASWAAYVVLGRGGSLRRVKGQAE